MSPLKSVLGNWDRSSHFSCPFFLDFVREGYSLILCFFVQSPIDSSTLGTGNAGAVQITATGDITADGENSDGLFSGITSLVSPDAEGDGSDIVANAQQGIGGNISINAESLFGIQERTLSNLMNDINASSNVSGLDGTINISSPDINPIQGATELPTNVVEPDSTTAQACEANRESLAKNGLNITGKGGIPADPALPLNSLNITVSCISSVLEKQIVFLCSLLILVLSRICFCSILCVFLFPISCLSSGKCLR